MTQDMLFIFSSHPGSFFYELPARSQNLPPFFFFFQNVCQGDLIWKRDHFLPLLGMCPYS